MPDQNTLIDLGEWYSSRQARERLAANNPDHYVRIGLPKDLARRGRIRFLDLGARAQLYRREDVDNYRFSNRGPKPKRPASVGG